MKRNILICLSPLNKDAGKMRQCVCVCVKLLHRYSKCFEQLVCAEGRRVHSNVDRQCVRKEDVSIVT